MKAIGKRINGETVEFEVVNGEVVCTLSELIELKLPKGIKKVFCSYNYLTELTIPKGVECVYCNNNNLTELILPKSIKEVYCSYNLFVNDENIFINPVTGRVVLKQNGLFYCGCFCGKTESELKEKCLEVGFNKVIEYFKL